MHEENDSERLEELRKRLYARGQEPEKRERTELKDEPEQIPKDWQTPPGPENVRPSQVVNAGKKVVNKVAAVFPRSNPTAAATSTSPDLVMTTRPKKRGYRLKLIGAGLFFFITTVAVSSLIIMFGGNTISGENIAVSITGPFTVGGGEVIPLQIGVTNQNNVPIESATLIISYPPGTQSADNDGQELFTERLSLDVISSGETLNVPVRAQVFGEENSELDIKASIEYRVRGSNATFFKEAEPLSFKISSSPIVLSVDSVRRIASGQETDIEFTVSSNADGVLSDVLIRAEYPTGFDFTRSNPEPVSGQNVWLIDELEPEEEFTIVVNGALLGSIGEEFVVNFLVGVPSERDRFSLASVFSSLAAEFVIEEAFLDLGVVVNGVRNDAASIAPGRSSNVSVEIQNTLSDAIYDGVVELKLSGNALSDSQVSVSNGFYDSNTRTISWDISSDEDLERITPGESQRFSFRLTPKTDGVLTPQINLDASVRARRVSESQVQEEIVGTVQSTIKVESEVVLRSEVGYNSTALSDTGPIPPVVGEATTYTITLLAENGSNEVLNTTVLTDLPGYVTYLDNTTGDGSFAFNPTTRELEWSVGRMSANSQSVGSFQVSILPSVTQIGRTPTLVRGQQLRAEDNFTNTIVRASRDALATEMAREAGYDRDNGVVRSE